jgi:hypothetical protein
MSATPIASPWREWARNNAVGQNFVWSAIRDGRLRVRRIGKRMIVLDEDGRAFLRQLPEGPGVLPENFTRKLKAAKGRRRRQVANSSQLSHCI